MHVRVLGQVDDASSPQFRIQQELSAGPHRRGSLGQLTPVRIVSFGVARHARGDELEHTSHGLAELEAEASTVEAVLVNGTPVRQQLFRGMTLFREQFSALAPAA